MPLKRQTAHSRTAINNGGRNEEKRRRFTLDANKGADAIKE